MRAAVYDTSGADQGALRVVELPDPDPAPGEVRVRMHVSGVNPTDWKSRERAASTGHWAQQIPNQDGAGVIDAVGEGVATHRVGERVWVYHAAAGRPTGTAATYVCLPEQQVVSLPDHVSFDHGAALGIPGITAHWCLFADGPIDGRTVLVTGGAGAVGHAAIQLARWGGARVIATVSTDDKARLAAEAGADQVLHYRESDFPDRLRATAGEGIDRVVDVALASNLADYLAQLSDHAVVASYARDREEAQVPIQPMMWANIVLRFVLVYGLPQTALDRATADITAALMDGAMRALPTHRFPLERIDDAHEAVRAGMVGKVLVDIP
jgi:NADPH:quinone reductase